MNTTRTTAAERTTPHEREAARRPRPGARPGAAERALVPLRAEAHTLILTDESAEGFVDAILDLATEVNVAEARLWAEVEQLVASDDLAGLRRLVALRRGRAPVEVVAALDSPGPRVA